MSGMSNEAALRARLRVRLLGGFAVSVDGRRVPAAAWRQRRAAAIVKLLALAPTHRLHREHLMDALWPDLDLAAQANNLRQMLLHARTHLEAAGMPKGLALRRDGDAVVLAPADLIWVDVHAFEDAVAQAWRAQAPATAQVALALYAGDLLPDDPYEDWAEQRRTALRASYLALVERLGQVHAERGEWSAAIGTFQRLVAAEPAREASQVALMRLYARAGHRDLALAQYDRLVTVLERELAAEPEPETRALAAAIGAGRYPAVPATLLPEERDSAPSSSPGATTLPTPVDSLIGREREIAEVRQLLASGRLVTLTGPGGIGKTRLAIAVAHAVTGAFPDGVCFVDLAPLRAPALLASAIAQALDVRETSAQPLVASLVAFLRDKRLLLALDNVEHLVEAAPLVSQLLEQAAQLTVLATSRMRLGLRGERSYAVPALAAPDPVPFPTDQVLAAYPATALFLERARAITPDVGLTGQDARAVAEICRRLDGLPLAIELAAARTMALSPRALLARLDRRLLLLTGGGRDLPERQQTLRKTIEWSYDLLAPDEQRLFQQVAVFVGGWTLDAAAAVLRLDGDPAVDLLERLVSLVDQSLVTRRTQVDGEVRFGLLETIREFGLERLADSGDEPAVRDRHAAWVVALAEQAAPHLELANQAVWLDRLERDEDNIRAALAWIRECGSAELGLRLVRALTQYWFIRGRLVEGCEQTLGVAELAASAAFPVLCSDALTAAGYLAREYGDYARAYAVSRESLALSHRLHDRKRAADALVNLGYVALQQGEDDDARALFQRSLTTNRELGNQQGIADSLSFLALTACYRGDLEEARRLNDESLAIWTALDDRQAIVWARTRLGAVLAQQGAYAAAYEQFSTSLVLAGDLDFRWGIAWACDGLASLAVLHDAAPLAVRLAAAAASVREIARLRLAPREQAELDRLLDRVRAQLGAEAFERAWSDRHRWVLDDLLRETSNALGFLRAGATAPARTA